MATQKKHGKRKAIQNSDPGKILELVLNLSDERCAQLQMKINTYLSEECESDLVFLIVVNEDRKEAFMEAVGGMALDRKREINLTPKIFEVAKSLTEHVIPLSSLSPDILGIVGPHLPKESQKLRVTMYPIPDKPFSVIVCVLAPKVSEEHTASYVQECFLFAWPTLKKSILYEYEITLKTKCQQLLRVAKRLFNQVASLTTLLSIAMDQAKFLTKAEYCSVMLVDPNKMQLIDSVGYKDEKGTEVRYPLNKGIVGQVVATGQLINSRNPKEHPNFDPEIDCRQKANCTSLICFPIRDQAGIIGVAELINKVGDPYFNGMDEEIALSFSIYCGICIMHSMVYARIQEAHIRNTLANELIMYHMKVGDTEVSKVLECSGFHSHPHAASLHFNSRALPPRELPCYVYKMFSDLGFDKRFDISPQKLVRFLLYVKKGYRDVPYHNWHHSFNVAQWAYAAIIHFKLLAQGYMTHLQAFMFLVAALVHDLDHRGTTNSFQIQGQTNLAALYSSEGSVMERHHLAQAMCILNTEGCDILEALPRKDYDRAILMLRDYVLATDLANFFTNLMEYKAISLDFIKGNRVHSHVLFALLMNAADLSDQLKDWGCVKKTAAAVLTEFFKQGDAEKSRGELPPTIMDRDKCFIPDLEISFLTTTCMPLFETLGRIIPKAQSCIKILENHIERWDAAKPVFAEVPTTAGLSVLLSPELDNLIEFNLKEKERLRLEAEAAAAAAVEQEEEEN